MLPTLTPLAPPTRDRLHFVLGETHTGLANALRRTCMSQVPTLAIEWVDIDVNETVVSDEFLSHRLGLIPLRSDPEWVQHLIPRDQCTCQRNCGRCSVTFSLHVRNDVLEILTVTDRDLVLLGSESGSGSGSENPYCIRAPGPGAGPIPIVELGRGDSIQLLATAQMGIGREHDKWSPTSIVTFEQEPVVEVNDERVATLTLAQRRELVASCATRTLVLDEKTGRIRTQNPRHHAGIDCVAKAHELGVPDAIRIRSRPDTFVFDMTTTGTLDARFVVVKALEHIDVGLSMVESACARSK